MASFFFFFFFWKIFQWPVSGLEGGDDRARVGVFCSVCGKRGN